MEMATENAIIQTIGSIKPAHPVMTNTFMLTDNTYLTKELGEWIIRSFWLDSSGEEKYDTQINNGVSWRGNLVKALTLTIHLDYTNWEWTEDMQTGTDTVVEDIVLANTFAVTQQASITNRPPPSMNSSHNCIKFYLEEPSTYVWEAMELADETIITEVENYHFLARAAVWAIENAPEDELKKFDPS